MAKQSYFLGGCSFRCRYLIWEYFMFALVDVQNLPNLGYYWSRKAACMRGIGKLPRWRPWFRLELWWLMMDRKSCKTFVELNGYIRLYYPYFFVHGPVWDWFFMVAPICGLQKKMSKRRQLIHPQKSSDDFRWINGQKEPWRMRKLTLVWRVLVPLEHVLTNPPIGVRPSSWWPVGRPSLGGCFCCLNCLVYPL